MPNSRTVAFITVYMSGGATMAHSFDAFARKNLPHILVFTGPAVLFFGIIAWKVA